MLVLILTAGLTFIIGYAYGHRKGGVKMERYYRALIRSENDPDQPKNEVSIEAPMT